MKQNPNTSEITRIHPSLWKIFSTWLIMGIQSFGGGSSTFFLIHQTCINNGWISEEEFVRTWALAQISPGINLLKLTVLVGHKLRGWPGLLAGAAGLLIPSALITVLMTAGFALIRSQPLVQAAMKGVLPATIGLSLAMAYQMGQPLLARAQKEGRLRLATNLAILAASGFLLASGLISPVLVLLLAGVAAMLLMAVIPVQGAAELRPGPAQGSKSGDQ